MIKPNNKTKNLALLLSEVKSFRLEQQKFTTKFKSLEKELNSIYQKVTEELDQDKINQLKKSF